MNRSIKFRIWDKKLSKLVTKKDLPIENIRISDPDEIIYTINLGFWETITLSEELEEKRYTFQQNTGLFDINGIEIFEGDILEINYTDPFLEENHTYETHVIYDEGAFRTITSDVFYDETKKRYGGTPIYYHFIGKVSEHNEEVKVKIIGNSCL